MCLSLIDVTEVVAGSTEFCSGGKREKNNRGRGTEK